MRMHLIQGTAVQIPLADRSVHCIVTSPPYWGLRKYKTGNLAHLELGSEPLHDCGGWVTGNDCGECFVCHVRQYAREFWRVLRDDGVMFLNLGDSYFGGGRGGGGSFSSERLGWREVHCGTFGKESEAFLKPKDLCGIPWRVALALQADGWTLRSDVIWKKPNAMPESCTDRPAKDHEYLFLFSKSRKYYFDHYAIKEPADRQEMEYRKQLREGRRYDAKEPYQENFPMQYSDTLLRNKRTVWEIYEDEFMQFLKWKSEQENNIEGVWTIATRTYKGAHFATFPPELIEPCIKAGTSERGCCPECGKPWKRIIKKGYRAPVQEDVIAKMVANGVPRQKANLYDNSTRDPKLYAENPDRTLGWRPQCNHYDDLYKSEMPKARSARKRQQREVSGDWWKRARKRPGFAHWEVKPCIVFDPFSGSGTTVMTANHLGRRGIGLELASEYIELSKDRIGIKALTDWEKGIDGTQNNDLGPMFSGLGEIGHSQQDT